MKLSQIRNLSWTAALTSVAVSGFLVQTTIQDIQYSKPEKVEEWVPAEPDLTHLLNKDRMSDRNLKLAVSFITKRAPPPPPPEPVGQTITEAPAAPVEEVFVPDMRLVLIAFDETAAANHSAFIIKDRYAHPYFVGDYIEWGKEKLVEINRTYVMIESANGQRSRLELEVSSKKVASVNDIMPVAIVTPSAPVRPQEPVQANKPPPPPKKAQQRKYRTVPKTRRATYDPTYGINIVEYDIGGEDRRFAISARDQKKLENMKFRLMSEVSPDIAYDDKGNAIGIRVDFMKQDPLLQRYGIQNGDILTQVNDQKVNSVEGGMQLYEKIDPNTRRVRVKIVRNDRPFFMWLEMDDFPNAPPPER